MRSAAYGSWESPLSAEMLARGNVRLGFPSFDRDGSLFQGLDDKVVPAAQTERMAASLVEQGVDAEYHSYAGEQHGFRKAETIRHVLDTELAFFRRVLAHG